MNKFFCPALIWFLGASPCGVWADIPAIPMVHVVSGETETVDLRLIAPDMKPPVEGLGKPEGWIVSIDGRRLFLQAVGRPSIGVLELTDREGQRAFVPVRVTLLPLHIFIYRAPAGSAQPLQVSAAGTFNGWSSSASPMSDPDGDGVFRREERLPPGRHLYKFVVDGNWMPDPDNPRQTEDGFKNSILDMGAGLSAPPILVPWSNIAPPLRGRPDDIEQYGVTFRLVGEGWLDTSNVLVLRNGMPVDPAGVSYQHPYLTVQAPKGYQTLRVEALTTSGARLPPIFLDHRPAALVRDDILYFAMTDRFFNRDTANDRPIDDPELGWDANFTGGDFSGVTQKIKSGYFDRLGATALWISPPNDQPEGVFKDSLPPFKKFSGYHGYWPVHAERTEDRFGTLDELRELVSAAHGKKMRVLFDFVANHVHQDHPFFRDHPDWFGSVELAAGGKNIRKWENPLTTWFDDFLPDIDYEKDTPLQVMASNARWWLDQTGADGFRLDAVKHVPPAFWMELREKLRGAGRDYYLVGETIDSRRTIMKFVGPGALDGQFDFPLYWPIREVFALGKGSFSDLDAALQDGEQEYDPTAVHSTLLGNHDFARFMCYADGDGETGETVQVDHPESYKKISLAFAFLLTQSGVPTIYYGDEIGMTGGKDPDNRRVMRFGESLSDSERRVLESVEKFSAIRRSHPALRRGARRAVHVSTDAYAYVRAYFDDRLLVVFNRSSDTEVLELTIGPEFSEGRITGLLSGREEDVSSAGKTRLAMPPMDVEIWVRKK